MADETTQLREAGFEIVGGLEPDYIWRHPDRPELLRQAQALALVAEQQEEEE